MLRLNAGNGSRVADDLHPVWIQIDFDRLRLALVAPVVNRVDNGFLQCWQRIADPASRLGVVRHLLEMSRGETMEVADTLTDLLRQGSPKGAFLD